MQRALGDVELPPEDAAVVRMWVNEEVPQFQSAGYTTFLVFGSYRGSYHETLRIAQYELAKPTTTTAVVLGDTPPLGSSVGSGQDDPLEFLVKFHLLTEFADWNVAIYEKESGGEAVELGVLTREGDVGKTVVLPRDYF